MAGVATTQAEIVATVDLAITEIVATTEIDVPSDRTTGKTIVATTRVRNSSPIRRRTSIERQTSVSLVTKWDTWRRTA